MTRDKEKTKARILAAVGKLLAESGFQKLGVNAISREAGVDKVLIYRYFKDLPSLLQCFGQEGDYWIKSQELIGDESTVNAETLADWMAYLLLKFLSDLKGRPITQEIMRWELLEGNELTRELATVRDQVASEVLQFLEQKAQLSSVNKDIPAISAVLVAGVIYLTLRTKVSDSFMGINLSSSEGQHRIKAALESILQAIIRE